jgi:hypothetical protein
MNASFIIDGKSRIHVPDVLTPPVEHALGMLLRDLEKVLGSRLGTTTRYDGATISIGYATKDDEIAGRPEAFALRFSHGEAQPRLSIVGTDDLGIVYGVLHVSTEHLGVDPFWFWTDKEPQPRPAIVMPLKNYISPARRVRYRGWFVNDEVCLLGWTDTHPPPREVWFPVFEALLRCGGNMVIPGTDLPRNGVHSGLASEMGLYLTHHHAEPLGAEMFLRAHPDKEPSYAATPGLFEALWEEAIEQQRNRRVVWVLGFRGQGDRPFWEQDPSIDTAEKRGELISRVIERQFEMVQRHAAKPVCCTYLYGEIMELYQAGCIRVPEGVIKVWSDNGYGKMVSRRQGNHNPRVPSLPRESERGPHGLYYHVTFHDLQASSHLTMLANPPELVNEELGAALRAGAGEYLLVNCGNIRPHVLLLDLVAKAWDRGQVDARKHVTDFSARFFPSAPEETADCYRRYFQTTIRYGKNEDDRAGEEFYHHPARRIVDHWLKGMTGRTCQQLHWATGDVAFEDQVETLRRNCDTGRQGWRELRHRCAEMLTLLQGPERSKSAIRSMRSSLPSWWNPSAKSGMTSSSAQRAPGPTAWS